MTDTQRGRKTERQRDRKKDGKKRNYKDFFALKRKSDNN